MKRSVKRPRKSASIRKRVFIHAYAKEQNAKKAALIAGYSQRTADKQGSRLLNCVEVRSAIDRIIAKRVEKFDVDAESVLGGMVKLARANMLDYVVIDENGQADVDLSKITRDQGYAIQEIKVDTTGGTGDGERRLVLRTSFKLAGKEKPLEMLAKHLKLLTDVVKHEGLEGLADLVRTRRKAVGA